MKKNLAVLLSVLMIVFCFPVGAISLQTVESAEETTNNVSETVESTQNSTLAVSSANLIVKDTDFSDYMLGKSGTTLNLTAAENVTWTLVDTDKTGAVLSGEGMTATLTASGLYGNVTVRATSVADANAYEEVVIRLIGGDKVRPGLNMWTGNLDAYGFDDVDPEIMDDEGSGFYGFYKRDKELVTVNANFGVKEYGENANNIAVYMQSGWPHFSTAANVMPVVEADRPVDISFEYVGDTDSTAFHLVRNSLNALDATLTAAYLNNTNDTWTTYRQTVKGANVSNATNSGTYYIDDTTDVKSYVFFLNNAASTNNVYMDNFRFYPYYKITYIGLDGETVAATEYVLYDENGNFLESYTYDLAKVDGATGYALEKGGAKISGTAIELNNEDIVLYAVDTEDVTFTAGGNSATVAVAQGAYTIPSAEELNIDVVNFRCWTDGTEFYIPGTEIADSAAIAGKTLEAVVFEAQLFDEKFGDLIALYDFEGKLTPVFANQVYDANENGTQAFWAANGISGVRLYAEEGNTAAEVYTGETSASYRFAQTQINSNVPGKFTTSAKVKLMSADDRSKFTDTLWVRISAPTNDTFEGVSVNSADFSTWHTGYSSTIGTSIDAAGINWSSNGYNTSYLFDDFAVYVFPSDVVVFKDLNGNYVRRTLDTTAATYTFPTAEELSVDADAFLRWTDGTNMYKPGEQVALSAVQYKVFTPYCQDYSLPAVIFKYEGDTGIDGNVVSESNGAATYSETITDEGRNVLHINASNKSANKDYRLTFKSGDNPQYDVNEYKHFQFVYKTNNVYKVDDTADAGYSEQESWNSCVYVNYDGNGGYYNGDPFVLYQFDKYGLTKANGDEYVIFEKDLSEITTTDGYPIGYGFTIDPVNTSDERFGHDIYIDYVRVYRAGVVTVTYNTNAPDGANVISEVSADTNRGVGTGYLLKGLRPEVEGYFFMGWALDKDATADETVDAIDLTNDTTVYAVWEKVEAVTLQTASIRTKSPQGMRYAGYVSENLRNTGVVEEYGFIVARAELFENADYSTLKFNSNGDKTGSLDDAEIVYVSGAAYTKGGTDRSELLSVEGANDIFSSNVLENIIDDGYYFSVALVGFPEAYYKDKVVGKTYVKIDGEYYYGEAVVNSIYDVAVEYDAKYQAQGLQTPEYITSVIKACS